MGTWPDESVGGTGPSRARREEVMRQQPATTAVRPDYGMEPKFKALFVDWRNTVEIDGG